MSQNEQERESNTAGPEQQNRVNRQNHEKNLQNGRVRADSTVPSGVPPEDNTPKTDRQTEQLKVRERERESEPIRAELSSGCAGEHENERRGDRQRRGKWGKGMRERE